MFDFSNTEIFRNEDLAFTITEGSVAFNALINGDIGINSSKVSKIDIGTVDATLALNCTVNVHSEAVAAVDDFNLTLAEVTTEVSLPGLPVYVEITTRLIAKLDVAVGAAIDVNLGFSDSYSATLGMEYGNNAWSEKNSAAANLSVNPVEIPGTVNLIHKLTITPEVRVMLYGNIGAYFTPALWEQFDLACTHPSLDWNASLDLGLEATVGASIAIFGDIPLFSDTYAVSDRIWAGPDTLIIVSGNNQTGTPGKPLTDPIKVIVKDSRDNPLGGVPVHFRVMDGDGSVSQESVITNASGQAETSWTPGPATGPQAVKAAIKNAGGVIINEVEFSATIPGAWSIEMVSGNNQTGTLGQQIAEPIKVIVKDSTGNPFPGAEVTFSANNGSYVIPSEVTTDADGIASAAWTLGSTDNTQTVSAIAFKGDGTTPLIGSPMTFSASCGCTTFMAGGYEAVQIGTQVWMAKNLIIPTANSWVYPGASPEYGRLYYWEAALSACPAGWHLPSDGEWTTLTTFLGGEEVAGGKLTEAGTTHWLPPNTGATNSSCFTALPGGYSWGGGFGGLGNDAGFWSASKIGTPGAWNRYLSYDGDGVGRGNGFRDDGFSVRCLRNN